MKLLRFAADYVIIIAKQTAKLFVAVLCGEANHKMVCDYVIIMSKRNREYSCAFFTI